MEKRGRKRWKELGKQSEEYYGVCGRQEECCRAVVRRENRVWKEARNLGNSVDKERLMIWNKGDKLKILENSDKDKLIRGEFEVGEKRSVEGPGQGVKRKCMGKKWWRGEKERWALKTQGQEDATLKTRISSIFQVQTVAFRVSQATDPSVTHFLLCLLSLWRDKGWIFLMDSY